MKRIWRESDLVMQLIHQTINIYSFRILILVKNKRLFEKQINKIFLPSFLRTLQKTISTISIYTKDPWGFTKIPRINFRRQKAKTIPIITRRIAIVDGSKLVPDLLSVSMSLISSPKDVSEPRSERINKDKGRSVISVFGLEMQTQI